ncbi:MAG TPA: hypothetical protein VHJ37_06810 [Thermoleophilaceae bacterium]|jgi:hypothetical protein|nr:hypothetical protein [Thermoleophilaceae bacterium]
MPVKTYDEYDFGFSWVMDEPLERTSHALVADGKVWLIDPVDEAEAVDRATALGAPAAVLQLLDRHDRDCAKLAERLGVFHVKVPDVVPGSPFEAIPAVRLPLWQETALWWPEHRALVVAEVLGSAPPYTGGVRDVGVHIFLRAFPPGSLRSYRPAHLLMGHGRGLHGERAATALDEAYEHARGDLPRVLKGLAGQLRERPA